MQMQAQRNMQMQMQAQQMHLQQQLRTAQMQAQAAQQAAAQAQQQAMVRPCGECLHQCFGQACVLVVSAGSSASIALVSSASARPVLSNKAMLVSIEVPEYEWPGVHSLDTAACAGCAAQGGSRGGDQAQAGGGAQAGPARSAAQGIMPLWACSISCMCVHSQCGGDTWLQEVALCSWCWQSPGLCQLAGSVPQVCDLS